MPKKKIKFSERFPEDSLNRKISLQHFLMLKDYKKDFTKEITSIEQGNEVIKTIQSLKEAVNDQITILKTQQIKSNLEEQKTNKNESEKTDYIEIYKEFLKIKNFKDFPNQEINYNMQERDVKAKLLFSKSKKIFEFKVFIRDTEGDQSISADLSYNGKTLWEYDSQENEEGSFYEENCKSFIEDANLNEIDNRKFQFIVIDVSLSILEVLADKYGEKDDYGMGWGVDEEILQTIFKIEEKSRSKRTRKDTETDEEDK